MTSECVCVRASMLGGEVGKKQRPPTVSAPALTAPPSPLCYQSPAQGPAFVCGSVNPLVMTELGLA
jgi:hypothetical protein